MRRGETLSDRDCPLCGNHVAAGTRCKVCRAARTRSRKYGITFEQALQIPKTCEACHREVKLFVDHDHDTGDFRGWLCHDCNAALGRVNDNIQRLHQLIDYLSHWGDARELEAEEVYSFGKA